MNMESPLPFDTQYPGFTKPHPAATLVEFLEQHFSKTCTQLHVKRNAIICNQGAKLSFLYLIEQGEILLTRLSQDGRETLICILGPGDFFGESSLLSGTQVTFSAIAKRRSVLFQLPDSKFKRMLDEPRACRVILEAIARRCNDAWTQMEVLSCAHVRDKVRSGLLWLSERIGVETHEGVRIDLNQTQLAHMVGCARETLSREVSELRRLHAVDVRNINGRKSLFVVNPGELGQYL
jgi:CRP/FNR family cyclic AMP-dependent transcriptional regulator